MALFGTAGIRGSTHTAITPAFMHTMGRALALYVGGGTVVCGQDARRTSPPLAAALQAALMAHGCTVLDVGVVPTPVLAFASWRYGVPAAMITASHNPPQDNGIKVFSCGREVGRAAEVAIERLFGDTGPPFCPVPGHRMVEDVMGRYVRHIVSRVAGPSPHGALRGLSFLVDGGNGVGTSCLARILGHMGAMVTTVNSHVSGQVPGRPSEPTPHHLAQTLALSSHLGVHGVFAQDGDADRIVLYLPDGTAVAEDTLLAYFADRYAGEGDCVVLSIDTSRRTDEVLARRGIPVHRVPLGYLHDGVEALAPAFAGEPWKHIHPHIGPWIDGMASAAMLAVARADRPWEDLFAAIPSYPFRKESVPLPSDEAANRVVEALKKKGNIDAVSTPTDGGRGMRLDYSDGSWVLVRPSGTEPKLRVLIEGPTSGRVSELWDLVTTCVERM